MKQIFIGILLLMANNFLFGQNNADLRIPGEVLIHFNEDIEVSKWLNNQRINSAAIELTNAEKIGRRHNIYEFKFNEKNIDLDRFMATIKAQKGVITAQYNYYVSFRNLPSDDLFSEQWDMDIISAPQAWDITTGGQTSSGTRIVVANMDSGFEPNHQDLKDNIWHNQAETLGDGIDNDGNGLIDDDIGWDYHSGTPNVAPGLHGISTTGIIGATGDNGVGVTGVNWDVDLMLFSFVRIDSLIKSYEFIIDQRMLFNESNGTNGVFIVAANASFGQARVFCEAQPLWGAMFDLLGEAGILTSSGVANDPYNADQKGDMPATCPSEYLIIACNTDSDDNLDQTSAYGPVSVDLGSPGGETYTTKSGSTYGTFGGTSAATPHVTGAIALMYSAPIPNLEQMAIEHPAETALLIRSYILSTVDPLVSMEGKTVTGGRLNIGHAIQTFVEENSNILGDLELESLIPNPADKGINVKFLTPNNGDYFADVYNAMGQKVSSQKVMVNEVGIRSFYLDTSRLPHGTYILNFGREDDWLSRKFVVVR